MSATTPLAHNLERLQRTAFRVGGGAAVLCLVGLFVDRDQFFRSWLIGFLFWLAPALGSLAIVMLHNMTGGAWGFTIKRLLEAAMRTLPALAALALPILLGIGSLYEWSHADVVANDEILQRKEAYLNVPFFIVRTVLYFAIWIFLARKLIRLAERYDRTLNPKALRRIGFLSGFGLVLYFLTMSFASFDWGMSLEPHWFSTIYGVHFIIGQGLSTLCLAVIVCSRLVRHDPFSRWIEKSHFHDLGNLMLAFVMLWAYISFSQFLIVWSGNLPEETPYYLTRTQNGWQVMALVLVVCHFAAPFFILLSRRNKRTATTLARLATVLFLLRFVDYVWLIAPSFHHGEMHLSWLDVAAPVAIGGIWIGLFTRNLRGRPLISLHGKLLKQLEEAPQS